MASGYACVRDLTLHRKLFRWFDQSDVFICPVAQFIALAIHDNAFCIERLNDAKSLLSLRVPEGQTVLTIHTKKSMQKQAVLRQASGSEFSDNAARKRIRALAVNMGMAKPEVTFYSFRRAVLNVVDGE